MTPESVTGWLLEAQTPSIRYLTLTRLMGLGMEDPRVAQARADTHQTGAAAKILSRQTDLGSWTGDHSYYTPKYTATHWSMLLLDELAVDGADERMQRGAAYMLNANMPWGRKQPIPARMELECLFGNILRYVARCGMAGEPRAQAMIDFLARCGLESGWNCSYNHSTPCAWGAARALWGLAAVPAAERSPLAQQAIASGLRLLLEDFSLVDANYPTGDDKIHPMWFDLNFPLFYQADILFILRLLGELGALAHPNARPALDWLRARQQPDGRFRGKSPFHQRTYTILGKGEETDRWVTLHARSVLQQAG